MREAVSALSGRLRLPRKVLFVVQTGGSLRRIVEKCHFRTCEVGICEPVWGLSLQLVSVSEPDGANEVMARAR